MGAVGGPVEPAAMRGEARALVSRSALLHNAALLAESAAPARLCGVVKADAYGHSAVIVADALTRLMRAGEEARPAVEMLAVATVEEAAMLGRPPVPVLVLRPVAHTFAGRQRELFEHAIGHGYVLSVLDGAGADDLERLAVAMNTRASVHLAMDTGMTREGIARDEFAAVVERVRRSPALKLHSVSTHFSDADDAADPITTIQAEHFAEQTAGLAAAGVLRHAANSGGAMFLPTPKFDLARTGIALYGVDPTGKPSGDRPLRPALKLVAPLTQIREVRAGASVGYNRRWTARRPSRVGLVPAGYGDGYPRLAGNKAVVRVAAGGRDAFAPVVGNVSMDYLTVDLTDTPHIGAGDEVTLIDDDPLSPASVYALAKHARTIPYEVLCNIGRRIPRVAVDPSDAELEAE